MFDLHGFGLAQNEGQISSAQIPSERSHAFPAGVAGKMVAIGLLRSVLRGAVKSA